MPSERFKLAGVVPIVPTPFHADGDIDFAALERITDHLLRSGCAGVTLFGIAGEYYKLTDAEMEQMVRCVAPVCRQHGRPLLSSVTRHATVLAVRQAERWVELGADHLMLLPPFFLKPGAGDLLAHMKAVVAAVPVPVMLQYAPEQTGVAIPPERLAAVREAGENACYFKIESRPPGAYMTALRAQLGDDVGLFVGNAGFQMIEGYARGAIGVMPGASMFDVYVRLDELLKAGCQAEATALHESLVYVLNHIRQNVEQIIHYEKRILARRGLMPYAGNREPAFTADEHYDALFDAAWARLEPELTG